MSSVPAGKRSWKCPECGDDLFLSVTQLDPIACEACLTKMKTGSSAGSGAGGGLTQMSAGPFSVWQALPETAKLGIAAAAFMVGLLIGLTMGFFVGRATVPRTIAGSGGAIGKQGGGIIEEKEEERPEPPGPGYKWVRGRTRQDGSRGPGHWAKDPFYKGDDGSSPKRR
jgi:DNA-directed RNA polymerase subunit RPC12/RpoP